MFGGKLTISIEKQRVTKDRKVVVSLGEIIFIT